MVKLTNVLSLTGNGLKDWVVQRVSAVVLAVYALFLLAFIFCHPNLDYLAWQMLFQGTAMRVFSLLALVSLSLHAWVGLWTVVTDYLKPLWLRWWVMIIIIFAILSFLIWGIMILWGI